MNKSAMLGFLLIIGALCYGLFFMKKNSTEPIKSKIDSIRLYKTKQL